MSVPLYDAHNHLQDERLKPHLPGIIQAAREEGIARMVVNGSCEADWPEVSGLARQYPQLVLPSFGCHPWYVKDRFVDWKKNLIHHLDEVPSAVGEIGLDKWIKDYDLAQQEDAFITQWRLAVDRNLPVSIHCLQAWGRLLEILQREPRLPRGFVLHSFGGPKEMISDLAGLGAYFSLPGYFMHARKEKQREAFRHVPKDRLLIETDAPDQLLPEDRTPYPLTDQTSGKPINHPANLRAVYQFASEFLGIEFDELAKHVETNFFSAFGPGGTPSMPLS